MYCDLAQGPASTHVLAASRVAQTVAPHGQWGHGQWWAVGVKSKFLDTSALVWLPKSLDVSFDRVAGCGALAGRQRRNLFLQILSRSRANCSRPNPRSASLRIKEGRFTNRPPHRRSKSRRFVNRRSLRAISPALSPYMRLIPLTIHFHRRFPDGVTLPGAAWPGF